MIARRSYGTLPPVRLVFFPSLFLALACSGTDDPGARATTDAGEPGSGDDAGAVASESITLGFGQATVAPAPGGEVGLVFGAQGGWHIDVSVEVIGLDPEGMVLGYRIVDQETDRLLGENQRLLRESRVVRTETGFLRLGDRAILTEITDDSEAVGRTVVVTAEADPAGDGPPVSDSVAVRVRPE